MKLDIITGATGSGKTLMAVGLAIANFKQGKNVLYVGYGSDIPDINTNLFKFVDFQSVQDEQYIKHRDAISVSKYDMIIIDEYHRTTNCNEFWSDIKRCLYSDSKSMNITIVTQNHKDKYDQKNIGVQYKHGVTFSL